LIKSFILFTLLGSNLVWAQSFCVKNDNTLLHAKPSKKSAVSWRVSKFMPLQGTGKSKSGYIQVADVDGQLHWVLRKNVRHSNKCVVISTRRGVLRSGPGTHFSALENLPGERYSSYRDLGGEDGWTQVQDSHGRKGWINMDLIWKPIDSRFRMSFEHQGE
jgi:uncharacterized protein YgiM (DUF1202 family)